MKKKTKIILTILLAVFEISCISLIVQEKTPKYFVTMLIFAGIYFAIIKIADKKQPAARELHSKIKGVTFNSEKNSNINRQDLISKLCPGDVLKAEKYTFNNQPAIMLLNADGIDVGTIDSSIVNEIYNEKKLNVSVLQVTGGDDLSYGCNILIKY